MSETTPDTIGSLLREATLGYVWRQWSSVGAMVSAPRPARVIVDPEALILMSLCMIENEPRLADVLWSWSDVNSPLVSVQRLGNLRASFPPEVGRRLSGLADLRVREEKDTRWQSLVKKNPAVFAHRNPKARAVEPRLNSWATLMLQLRLGLGVGVKADVLTYLLGVDRQGSEWAGVSRISDALGYTPAAVRRAADDLAKARFIQPLDAGDHGHRSQRIFAGRPAPWSGILGLSVHDPGMGLLARAVPIRRGRARLVRSRDERRVERLCKGRESA